MFRKKRSTRAKKDNFVSIKRTVTFTDQQVSNSWSCAGYAFTLAMLPSYTEFTQLFEQYRIMAIKLKFLPCFSQNDQEQSNANSAATAPWAVNPRMYVAIDKDGQANTGSESAIQQYGGCRVISEPLKAFSVYIKNPCVQLGTANAITIVGGAAKARQWIDTDNYNVQHYGCAVGGVIPFTSAGYAFRYYVVATYYMQFKGAQ